MKSAGLSAEKLISDDKLKYNKFCSVWCNHKLCDYQQKHAV